MKKIKILTASLLCLCIQYAQAQDVNEELLTQARKCDLEEVKALIAKGAKVNFADEDGVTPLMEAVSKGNDCKEVIDYLLNQPGINLKAIDAEGNNLLHLLANEDVIEGYVSKFKAAGVNINALNKDGKTPLVCAIQDKNELITKELIVNDADINIKFEEQTPFEIAVEKDRDEVIETFAYGKITPEIAKQLICYVKKDELIKKLIAAGADINTNNCNEDKKPLLADAVTKENPEYVTTLIKNGANINGKDDEGTPVLFFTNNKEILKLLIQNKVDIKATDAKNNNVLMDCLETNLNPSYTNNIEAIKFWAENGLALPTTFKNKSIYKYIDEYTYEFPEFYKKTPENEAKLAATCKTRKEELKAYLKSKGVK